MSILDAGAPISLPLAVSPAGYPQCVASSNRIDNTIRTIDLFAGAGGLTAGMHTGSNRFRPVVAVEADRVAAATYKANYPASDVFAGRIQEWIEQSAFPAADVIVGGPPCQGFSALGKQDVNDIRNSLWEQYARVIRAVEPKYFVVENVAQFLDSFQFAEFRRQTYPGATLADYDLRARSVLNAAEFGAPQRRLRTVIIGRRRDQPQVQLPYPTHDAESWSTVRGAWTGLPSQVDETRLPARKTSHGIAGAYKTSELHVTRNYTDLSQKRFRAIPYGGNRFDIPDEYLSKCWRRHLTGSGDVMGRLYWDRPSVTIRTEFVKPEKGRYIHPVEHRAITLQEGARLQGFDDDYLWCGSKTDIAKQIGNAVPIELGAAIARSIAEAI